MAGGNQHPNVQEGQCSNTHASTQLGHGNLSQVGGRWWYPWHGTSERARHITYTQGQSDNRRIKEHSSGCL